MVAVADRVSGAYVDVALPLALPTPLTYAVPAGLAGPLAPGCRVVVPVLRREMIGIVTAMDRPAPQARARDVLAAPDPEPVLGPDLMALARYVGHRYAAPPGLVLRAMLPAALFSVGQPVVLVEEGALESAGAAALRRITLNRAWELLQRMEGVAITPRYGPPRPGDVRHSQADVTLARRDLGHEPRFSFEDGLRRTLDWYRQTCP